MRKWFGAVLLVLAATAGCSTRICSGVRPEGDWYSPLTESARGSESTVALVERSRGRPLEVLLLSGGGQNGAFGAGFLNGWSRAGGRPRFDLVAGVSTGAILATFAFLGEPEDDAQMEAAYVTIDASDVFEKRFLLAVLFSDSMYRSDPLKRSIEHFVPNTLIDRVALASAEERQLWVGTVDLDRGAMAAWDMTALARAAMASGGDTGYDRFRAILLASAAVPVFFPPVMLDGAMHVDGALRELTFLRHVLTPVCRLRGDPERAPPGFPPPKIHLIVNAKIGTGYQCVDDGITAIGKRSARVGIDEALLATLHGMKALTDQHQFLLHLARIPDSVLVPENHNAADPVAMQALFELGLTLGANHASWESTIPHR